MNDKEIHDECVIPSLVDNVGRVLLPAPIRKAIGLRMGDKIFIVQRGETILLSKEEKKCCICGSACDDMKLANGILDKWICPSCNHYIKNTST